MRVALIPARGGSVRIPGKNTLVFAGKPMVQWPIEAAIDSRLFDALVLSTDDLETMRLGQEYGCVIHRRKTDDGTMGTQELAARILTTYTRLYGDVDEACVIYPCSPMLRARDLVLSHQQLTPRIQWVVSWLEAEDADAGCFYWGRTWSFTQRNPLTERPAYYPADPARFIDINTPADLARAESMFNALHP